MDTETKKGWYHCGRCGAIFQTEITGSAPERCENCEKPPALDRGELAFVHASKQQEEKEELIESESRSRSSHSGRSAAKKSKAVLFFLMGWLVFLVLLVGALKVFRADTVEEGEETLEIGLLTPDQLLVNENFAEFEGRLLAFLADIAPEAQSQHVFEGSAKVREMSGLSMNLGVTSGAELDSIGVLNTPEGKMIESLWNIGEGRLLEVVFRQNPQGEWMIDWEDLVRYSTTSWPLFAAGVGDSEGEFRVLARKRVGGSLVEVDTDRIVLMLPRSGHPDKPLDQMLQVEVDPESRTGRIIEKCFERRSTDTGAFGSKLEEFDPMGAVRLRVNLMRTDGEERLFVLQDILATHWLDIDDLGLEED